MEKLKDSEAMLHFLGDLSKFADSFGSAKPPNDGSPKNSTETKKQEPKNPENEKQPSPTTGIADEFIQNLLDRYFQQSKT